MTSTPCRDLPKTELLSVEEWLMVNVINHNTALQVHTKYGQFAQSIVRNAFSGMGFVIIEQYLLWNSQAAMGVFHGGSNDHFLAQWGLFLGREGVQQLRRERARQTNMALPFVHRQRGLKPSQSVRPNRSPKAAFSSEHFLPKGERWQIKVTSCSDTCLVSALDPELLPCNNSFTCIHQSYSLAHLLAEMDIQC